ncbi:enoyl-CoA hydratase [Cupriavidus metallidurans]|jgi:enoyl-CoA hydratase/carnithine racemase|uniref:Enoyl-CoA hydratase/isomerase n=2 Tax=Cupriavidus metallidurans TaxID=119219 RepID=Q1LBJ1_CUPMC|nr:MULTISPECIES: enoyl-CoA hydratase-related protein [Cupriavidus]ABF12485.1 Enoyl-CoA hydratase/isomerase [Cupriavidus metallidurans CH34]AVA35197.1 enoyl-CoA hydratase [Cupriavidus metallidurans]KWR80696.1 enoyl-CoA hydratase [Cupriavidus sp. SHE]KWW34359.1 putative enoyl-CoA hydratase echA8 [Cupriavidus metallidurans]MDE4921201.1 enoyl-CoA hydratase-related protein [Cupriavidus metallidurans]
MSDDIQQEGTLLVTREDAVATIVLNRPAKLNAFTLDMWRQLGEAFRELSADDTVRCVVVRGAGDRAFSPGNDIGEFATTRSNKQQATAYGAVMHGTAQAMQDCPHPVVAQIHGICVGGGLEVAAMADIRICGQSSRFGAPIKNLGLVMAHAEMAPLVRLIGTSRTLELLFEGRIVDAAEAYAMGLVSRVVPDDRVADEARATAQRIASGAPLVARWHKRFARQLAEGKPLSAADLDAAFDCFDTEDFRTGYRAFLAKETPKFSGR